MQENQLLDLPRLTARELLARRESRAPELVSVGPAAAVRQALNLMATWEVSQVPVIEGNQALGVVTESSLMTRALEQPALLDRPVREVMEPSLPVIDAGAAIDSLASLLSHECPAVLVQEGGKLLGIVSRYDLMRQMIGSR